jgi:hypothetical protein
VGQSTLDKNNHGDHRFCNHCLQNWAILAFPCSI